MASDAESTVLEYLKCAVCLEFAFQAVESDCCHSVFCEDCLKRLRPPACCPLCRSCGEEVKFRSALAVRKALDSLPAECPHTCGATGLTRSTIKDHASKCSSAGVSCSGCSWFGNRSAYLSHLTAAHGEDLVHKGHFIFGQSGSSANPGGWEKFLETSWVADGLYESRLGSSGVRYCGRPLPGRCGCCNGFCGPTNGCCCNDCMLVHVQNMNLPDGWLVNREGGVSRRSPSENRFYCGRKVMPHDSNTDGYCGPTNGNNCYACRKLESNMGKGWYSTALSWRSSTGD